MGKENNMNVNDAIAEQVRDRYKGQSGYVVAWYNKKDPGDFWFGPISTGLPDWDDSWDEDPIMKYFIVKV